MLGELLRRLAGGLSFSAPQSKGSPPSSLRSSSPSTPPCTPNFPGSFRISLRSSFGESGFGGPVDGRGDGNFRAETPLVEENRKNRNLKKQPKRQKNGNGRKRKKTGKKGNKRKNSEKVGSDTVPATPFAKSRFLRDGKAAGSGYPLQCRQAF